MTTVSKSPLLQVLGQDGSVMLANITGTDNPVAILDDKVLDLLFVQCRNAKAEALKTGSNVSATLDLCTTLDGALKSYRKIRDEYHHRLDIELERAEAEQRLQDAINAIQKSPPPQ
jgi:ABC-type transporter lipoprotein component MlaA